MKKYLFASLLALLFLAMVPTETQSASVSLAWDPPITNVDGTTITDLSGYKIYRGYASRNYSVNTNVGNVTTTTLYGITGLVYFAATAYNTSGLESEFSDELVWAAFAPNAPTISSYNYNSSTAKLTVNGSAPLLNNDGSSCAGQIKGYIFGFGKASRTTTSYTNTFLSTNPIVSIDFPVNSGKWYLSVSATNAWGSIGPWSSEISFNTSVPNTPNKLRASPLDLRQ